MTQTTFLTPASGLLGVAALLAAISQADRWFGPSLQDQAETGRELFVRDWTPNDPLAGGDGLGPVFNARSCVACHFQGGVGGAGPNEHNVLTFAVVPTQRDPYHLSGVIHSHAVTTDGRESAESLRRRYPVIPNGVRIFAGGCYTEVRDFDPVALTPINTPALFGVGIIDQLSDAQLRVAGAGRDLSAIRKELSGDFSAEPSGRLWIHDDGRVGKFGWKGQFATLSEFVAAACAMELGLSNRHHRQPVAGEYRADRNAAVDIGDRRLAALTAFCASLPAPVQVISGDPAAIELVESGERVFKGIGCASCHQPSVGGIDGIYTDFRLYALSDPGDPGYEEVITDVELPVVHQPKSAEWKTPPLWGVADTAPYMHDGSCATLEEAIAHHGGAADFSRQSYGRLSPDSKAALMTFLRTLRAPVLPSPPPAP